MRIPLFSLIALALGGQALADDSLKYEIKAISMVESYGGKYTNHQTLESGMHQGTRAGGWFGMMPLTAKDLIRSSRRLRAKYGDWLDRPNNELSEELTQNRRMDRDIALYFWKKLREDRSPERAACSWYRGPWSDECGPEAELDRDEYVRKFKAFYSQVVPRESASHP